jgi:hypothetical protein
MAGILTPPRAAIHENQAGWRAWSAAIKIIFRITEYALDNF